MIEPGSEILLTFQEGGRHKPRFMYDREKKKAYRVFIQDYPHTYYCKKVIRLSNAFLQNALEDPAPAYSLKVLRENDSSRLYLRLSPKLRIHLHVKQYVADSYGLDFGGNVRTFKWELV